MGNVVEYRGRIADQSRTISPKYARAVNDKHLHELIQLRCRLAAILDETDQLIVDRLVSRLESRLAEDIEERIREAQTMSNTFPA